MSCFDLCYEIYGYPITVFLQDGFFQSASFSNSPHIHLYPELHLVYRGSCICLVNGEQLRLHSGQALLVGENVFHAVTRHMDDCRRIVFQIKGLPDMEQPFKPLRINFVHIEQLAKEIENYNLSGRGNFLREYIRLLLMELLPEKDCGTYKPCLDRAFTLMEYINQNYSRNITLRDMADLLHLSPKQAGRVVVGITGLTFSEYLTHTRLTAAQYFLQKTGLPIALIAQQCGFASYNGFWKSFYAKNACSPRSYRNYRNK